jgi:hypothetical protein
MLTNFDLEKIAKQMKINLNGVWSKDELYGIPHTNGAYIVNMQDSGVGEGTHWVAFIKNKGTSYYFDSYGISPPIAVMDFLKGSKIGYSSNDIQSLSSGECGWFCLAFLLCLQDMRNALSKYNNFVNLFSENEEKNDAILYKLLGLELPKN